MSSAQPAFRFNVEEPPDFRAVDLSAEIRATVAYSEKGAREAATKSAASFPPRDGLSGATGMHLQVVWLGGHLKVLSVPLQLQIENGHYVSVWGPCPADLQAPGYSDPVKVGTPLWGTDMIWAKGIGYVSTGAGVVPWARYRPDGTVETGGFARVVTEHGPETVWVDAQPPLPATPEYDWFHALLSGELRPTKAVA